MTANDKYEVYAIRYAERSNRIRADSFIFTDDHTSVHPMDYFIWLIRNDERTILVDTGYDAKEATQRDRPILIEPSAALADIGVAPDSIDSIIVTHLHYDHAGGLAQFPQARLHLQEAEMVYATGPCMCHGALKMPFTADHVCETVKRVYAGKVTFHDGIERCRTNHARIKRVHVQITKEYGSLVSNNIFDRNQILTQNRCLQCLFVDFDAESG